MATTTGFKGIDVRQTGSELVFRAFLQTSAGALLTSGTVVFYIINLQSDGTILTYDFNDSTFKATAVTTETLAATYRKSNNTTTDTGFWTATVSTLTGFTPGGIYMVRCNCAGASPTDQMREFQYGSAEGDLVVTPVSTGVADLRVDMWLAKGGTFLLDTLTGALGTDTYYMDGQPVTATAPITVPANIADETTVNTVATAANTAANSAATAVSQTTAAQQKANVQAGLTSQGYTTTLATNIGTANTAIGSIASGATIINANDSSGNALATSAQGVAIQAKTDLIATNSGDSANAVTAQGNAATAAAQAAAANTAATSAASSASGAAASAGTAVTQTTAAAIAGAVLDVQQSLHVGAGSIGAGIIAAATGSWYVAPTIPTAVAIANQVWNTPLPGSFAAGTAGYIVANSGGGGGSSPAYTVSGDSSSTSDSGTT